VLFDRFKTKAADPVDVVVCVSSVFRESIESENREIRRLLFECCSSCLCVCLS